MFSQRTSLDLMPNFYLKLAKEAVERYIKKGEIVSPFNDLPKEILEKKAGTFITIEKVGQLRGCIGTYLPTKENIAEEIIHNAIAAATEDHRFKPIREEELAELSYTVYILSQPELVKDLKEIEPQKYGILIKNVPLDGNFIPKSGLLLPDLEGVDTTEKQIFIACQKGSIDYTREKTLIYKFTVEKYQ